MDPSRSARQEYLRERIDGAVFFDIDEVADKTSSFPHMLPSPEQFADHVGKLGVGNEHHVVVYDNNADFGFFSAPRVWWMMRVFGHRDVSVLDGGLPRWKFRGFPTTRGTPPPVVPAMYRPMYNPRLVRTFQQMMSNISTQEEQVVDARSTARFEGTAQEPRPSLPSGHIVGAHSLPFYQMINSESKILKSKDEIREEFLRAGVDLDKAMVGSCGSGVTACVLAFAAHMLGKDIPVYDGSWTEWAERAPRDTMSLGTMKEMESKKT